jgi:predicted HTH transcriptional regulator
MIALQDASADLTRQLLDWVLPQTESLTQETKRLSGKMVGKALETVCAFANTNGGWLLLGIEDAKKAQGRGWTARDSSATATCARSPAWTRSRRPSSSSAGWSRVCW